jgi:hypothetical protein
MKTFDSFFLLVLFLFPAAGLQAQLTPTSRIYNGYASGSLRASDLRLTLYPSAQYFVGKHLSAGGFLQVSGSLNNGLQLVIAEPEMRFYLNPDHPKNNWFVFAGTRLGIYNKDDENLNIPFQLRSGLGALTHIADGLSIESKLFSTFQRQGSAALFERPRISLNSYLVFYRARKQAPAAEGLKSATGKGNWMIGGSGFGGEYSTTTDLKSFFFQVNPSVGYFLAQQFLVGMRLPISYSILSTDAVFSSFERIENFSWTYIPFLRFYTGSAGQRVKPFAELRSRFYYRKQITTLTGVNEPEKAQDRDGSAQIGGGVDLFVSSCAAVEIGLFAGKNFDEGKLYGSLNIGFQYFLPKGGGMRNDD